MRLLHILSQRPGRSGSGVFLKAMVREAARRGYRQHVIAAGPPGTAAGELPPLDDDALTPITFPCPEAPFDVPGNSDVMPYPSTRFSDLTGRQVAQYLDVSRRVMEEVRARFRPDLVHAHHLWLMTALAREVFAETPVVATSHNAELRLCIKAPHLTPRVVPGIRRCDRVCVLTPQSLRDTVDVYGVAEDRIAITGAGYRDDQFHAPRLPRPALKRTLRDAFGVTLPDDLADPPGRRMITFVGRLSTAKGIPFLLDSIRRLEQDAAPPFQMVLVGATGSGEDGRLMDDLVGRAGDRVLHLGAQPEAAVALLLQCTDVFVLPSLFEGLPLVMLEAAACGCRCVVSALPTVTSWVPGHWVDRGGMELVPALETTEADRPVERDVPRFVADLSEALRRQLERPWSDADRTGFADELKPHTWSAVFDRYERVYRQLPGSLEAEPGPAGEEP